MEFGDADLTTAASAADGWLAGGGEMGALVRSIDWSETALGSVQTWPQSLRTSVSTCLNSRFPILIWWGPDFIKIYNDAYRPILGDKHPQSMGQAARACWPEIWHIIGPMLEGVLLRGEATWSENQLLFLERRGFSEECYFTFSYSPIRNESGGVGGVFCAVTETTGNVLGERRLRTLRDLAACAATIRSEQETWKSLIETLTDNRHDIPFALLYRADSDHTRAHLAGALRMEAGGAHAPFTIDLSAGEDVLWSLSRVASEDKPVLLEEMPIQGSSQSALVLPLARPGISAYGFLIAGISGRRPFDDDYCDFLTMVADRILTGLSNARAYDEEKRRVEALAEIDRAKTIFFTNVSHEFRTPLTLMLGPVEDLLARGATDLSPATKDQLELVNRNGLRLLRLVNTLLDFSRMEAGRMQASFVPTDLASLTAELAGLFRSAIERAGLRLLVDCRPLPEPVSVDRDMWEKIVLNLLSNAFKFTFDGDISVTVQQVGQHAELRVRDTGIGIPPEGLPRLFERFHRISQARSRTHEGSGIGLALVQELVKLHGGSIQVDSRMGGGSTFIVTVPIGTAHVPSDRIGLDRNGVSTALGAGPFVEEALRWLPEGEDGLGHDFESTSQQPSEPALAEGAEGESSAPRILVADDNADVRHYIARLLAERYQVETVPDGKAALQAIRRQRPDLIVTDVMMPNLDGFGLLREVRANPDSKTIPVIMLSARAGEESQVQGLEQGADDYLIKPFTARELLARVDAHVNMALIRRDAAEAIRESEQRFRRMADHAPVMVWVTDQDGACTFLSKSWYEFTGQTPGTGLGFGWLEAVHPDDRGPSAELFLEANRRREAFRLEYRLKCHDGNYYWHIDAATPFLSEREQFLGFIGSCIDVSERKRAEEWQRRAATDALAAAEANAKFRAFFDQGSYFAAVLTPDGTVVETNHLSLEGCGFSREEVIGKKFWDCGWWNRSLGVMNMVQEGVRQAAKGRFFRQEYPYFLADGTERIADMIIVPVKDEAGRVLFLAPTGSDITERSRTEAALRLERERLSLALKAGQMGVYDFDLTQDKLWWSEEIFAVFGVDRRRFTPTRDAFTALVHPDDRAGMWRHFEATVRERQEFVYEFRIVRPDGTVRWIANRARAEYDAAGEAVRHFGVAIDITERKQAEVALRESEQRFQIAARATNDAIWSWDLAANSLWWNEGVQTLFGYMADQVGSDIEWWHGHIHPDDRARVVAGADAVIHSDDTLWRDAYRFRRADGSYADVFDRGYAIRDDQGRCTSMIGAMQDLTDRKRAEESLRERGRFTVLRADLNAVLVGVERSIPAVLQRCCEILVQHLDLAFARIWTLDETEQVLDMQGSAGMNTRLDGSHGRVKVGELEIGRIAQTGRSLMTNDLVRDPNISDRSWAEREGMVAFAGYPMLLEGGVLGVMALFARRAFSDTAFNELAPIADTIAQWIKRRRAEAALRDSEEQLRSFAGQLERLVEARTDELLLSQGRLRELATELNLTEHRERTKLATELHDHLAQLLVLGRLKLGQAKRVEGVVRPCADFIKDTEGVLDDALAYTRTLVAGLSPPILREFGLAAALRWLPSQMERYHLTVAVRTPDATEWPITEDRAVLLFQSVRELLINITKHAETTEAAVTLWYEDEFLQLEVRDEGRGFDAAAVDRPSPASSKFGLFSIRERMKALDGAFEIESAPGKGTTARLTLPLQQRGGPQVAAGVDRRPSRPAPVPRLSPQPGRPIRVLLVDDHVMLRQGLRSIVTGYDHLNVVGEASNGVEAIQLAGRLAPEVIVMDVNMPQLDGIEATRRIKERHPEIAIIGLSVHRSSDVAQQLIAAGAVGYLTKESAADELCKAIEAAVRVVRE